MAPKRAVPDALSVHVPAKRPLRADDLLCLSEVLSPSADEGFAFYAACMARDWAAAADAGDPNSGDRGVIHAFIAGDWACVMGNVAMALALGVSVDFTDAFHETALHVLAARPASGRVNRVRSLGLLDLLLNYGADVNVRSLPGDTPLLLALATNQLEVAIRLLDAGADAFAVNAHCDGVWHLLLCGDEGPGFSELVGAFLTRGVSVMRANAGGVTPIALAARREDPALVRAMLDRPECRTRWPPVAAKDVVDPDVRAYVDTCTSMTLVALCARCIRRERLPLGEVAAVSYCLARDVADQAI